MISSWTENCSCFLKQRQLENQSDPVNILFLHTFHPDFSNTYYSVVRDALTKLKDAATICSAPYTTG